MSDTETNVRQQTAVVVYHDVSLLVRSTINLFYIYHNLSPISPFP